MRNPTIVAAALMVGLATACSHSSGDREAVLEGASSASDHVEQTLVEPMVEEGAATGVLAVTFRYAARTSVYAEGARHYLQVKGQDGAVVLRRDEGVEQGPGAGYQDSVRLLPGRYRLQTFQRGCDFTRGGDCRHALGPPQHRCTARILIRAGATTTVAITLALPDPCAVKVTRPA